MTDTTSRLRELLAKRSPQTVTLSVVLDGDLASEVLAAQAEVDRLIAAQTSDDEQADDVRASAPDAASELVDAQGRLSALVDRAAAARLDISMQLADARGYEAVLAQHPDADQTADGRRRFADSLLAACYQGVALGGEPVDPAPSWADLLEQVRPSYGELDEWRTKVLLGCMSAPHGPGAR